MQTDDDRTLEPPLTDRLQRARILERSIAARLHALLAAGLPDALDAQPFTAAAELASQHLARLDELASEAIPGAEDDRSNAISSVDVPSLARQFEELEGLVAETITAYGALYATARLLYDVEIADQVAFPFGEAWRDAAVAFGDATVVAVHAELLAAGFICRCVCPACGMGACLCTRNSLDTIRELRRQGATEPGEGIELRIPPRPGSEMERVGMASGDRILAVDGEPVRTNGELQRALRAHPIGQLIAIDVDRSGRREQIRAARVSDLP
jgi:hypothetical protein